MPPPPSSPEHVLDSGGPHIEDVLTSLDAAAYRIEGGWLPATVDGQIDGRQATIDLRRSDVHFQSVGVFEGLPSAPHATIDLTFELDLPERICGVPITGETLELTIDSLHPTAVWFDDRPLLDEDLPLVALGPAAITVVDGLHPGHNGTLRIRMRTGRSEAVGPLADAALTIHLTTPAVRARFDALDTANAQLHLAHALAATTAERTEVLRCAQLARGTLDLVTDALTRTLATVPGRLAPILERARTYRVWCIGHSHIDLSWMWDWADAREVVKRDVAAVVALMEDFPEFRFTHSQPAGYQVVHDEEPELFDRVRALVAQGRWEPATMQWVEGDANIASGPASARQLVEGVRFTQTQLGVRPRVHLAPDTFGHAGNLPQLSTSAGATVYYHHRGNPGIRAGGSQWPAYWWEGDDGTRLLALSTPVYLGPLTAGRVVRDLIAQGVRTGSRDVCYFYGVGDHGGGPTRLDLQAVRRLGHTPGLPPIACGTVGEFADALVASGARLPVHRGESMTVFEGCYVSHADAKRANRRSESALVAADTLTALAGLDPPAGLRDAWRTALFNQFHDIAGGSAVRSVYADQASAVEQVLGVAAAAASTALDRLERDVPAGQWAVTNPLGVAVQVPVELPEASEFDDVTVLATDGTEHIAQPGSAATVFVANLPPFATAGYRVVASKPRSLAIRLGAVDSATYPGARYLTVDTPHFYAQVRADCGVITTLFDKRRGVELVGAASARARAAEQVRPDLGLGVVQVLDEHPHIMTSWVLDEVYREESLVRGAHTEVIECGPVRAVLKTLHHVRDSIVTVRHTFYAELPRIDIELDIDWRELGTPELGVPGLAMAFTTRAQATAWYETPFAASTRPTDGLLVPALRWADIGTDAGGLAVLNDGTYGHETLGSRLRVHLARGSYDPDPLGDQGAWTTRFSLLPHAGSWREHHIVDAAAAFNTPPFIRRSTLRPAPASANPIWRPTLSGAAHVLIAEVKRADQRSGTVLRLYESTGRSAITYLASVPNGATVWTCALTEEPIARLPVDRTGRLRIEFTPFQVITLLVHD